MQSDSHGSTAASTTEIAAKAGVHWYWKRFDALSNAELYAILAARSAVFVVEQRCAFQDIDGLDGHADHLLGWSARPWAGSASLAAYLRVLPPGAKYAEPAIGRVLTATAHRGVGLGRALMVQGIQRTRALYGAVPIRIGAQLHLEPFYGSLGFQRASAPYDEDGIFHIEMLLEGQRGAAY